MRIGVINLKGGSGKTTLAVNVAGELDARGRAVELVDIDPQQSATLWSQHGGDAFPVKVSNVGSGRDNTRASRVQAAIESANERVGRRGIVVIDCPPELGDNLMLACLMSDVVLVPCTPSPLDVWAARDAVDTVRDARKTRKQRGKPKCLLVPSRTPQGTLMSRDLPGLLEALGEPIAPAMTQRTAHVEACVAGTSIDRHAPGSPAHADVKAVVDVVLSA